MRMRTGGIAIAAVLAAVGIALLAAEPAGAAVDGGCTATLNGTDLTHLPVTPVHAVTVGKDDIVPMTMTSVAGKGSFDNLKIQLAFAGVTWNVYNETANGGTWSKNVDVHSFAKYGVGLYELKGVGTFTDGTTCSGIAMVHVDGNPFSTVAGIAGAASAGVGVLSVLGAGVAAGGGGGGGGPGGSYTQQDAVKDEEKERTGRALDEAVTEGRWGWCFLFALAALPLLLLFGASAALMAVVAPAVRVQRRTWPFVVGALGGLFTGIGAGVLLQEYAVIYPSRTWAIVYLAGGIAFGLAVPVLRRSLGGR